MKEPIQNITLALRKPVLRKVKILAVERQDAYAAARERALARLARPVNLGTRGRVTWTRDSLHER